MPHRRPCLDCGQLHRNASRCPRCQTRHEQVFSQLRGTASERGYGHRWRRLAARILAEHRAAYGNVCPGWMREPHRAEVLTVDHIIPRAVGGSDERSNLQVLCRVCNSTKHTHVDTA